MSRRRKTNKKFKVIPEDNIVEFNFEKIKEMAEKKGIKAYLKGNGSVIEFESRYGSWISTITEGMEAIRLYHDTKDGKRHMQNIYFDYNFLCDSTERHDWFKTKRKGGNLVDDILSRKPERFIVS